MLCWDLLFYLVGMLLCSIVVVLGFVALFALYMRGVIWCVCVPCGLGFEFVGLCVGVICAF